MVKDGTVPGGFGFFSWSSDGHKEGFCVDAKKI
jgi:hypothetical protein